MNLGSISRANLGWISGLLLSGSAATIGGCDQSSQEKVVPAPPTPSPIVPPLDQAVMPYPVLDFESIKLKEPGPTHSEAIFPLITIDGDELRQAFNSREAIGMIDGVQYYKMKFPITIQREEDTRRLIENLPKKGFVEVPIEYWIVPFGRLKFAIHVNSVVIAEGSCRNQEEVGGSGGSDKLILSVVGSESLLNYVIENGALSASYTHLEMCAPPDVIDPWYNPVEYLRTRRYEIQPIKFHSLKPLE